MTHLNFKVDLNAEEALQMKEVILHFQLKGQEVSGHPTEYLLVHLLSHWNAFLVLTFVL